MPCSITVLYCVFTPGSESVEEFATFGLLAVSFGFTLLIIKCIVKARE